jgi:hypothetical protein
MALSTQKQIDLADLLDQLAPWSRWNAPWFKYEILDDFNRRACKHTTHLLRRCRGIVRYCARRFVLVVLLCTFSTLRTHLFGVSTVIAHHMKVLFSSVNH